MLQAYFASEVARFEN